MRRFALLACVPLLLVGVASCRKASVGGGSLGAEIVSVRVGIPPGPIAGDEEATKRDPVFKVGRWAPVFVTIAGKGKLEDAELVVQTIDSDDSFNEYAIRLPAIDFTSDPQFPVVTYVRPGKLDSPITVSLRARGQTAGLPEKSYLALEPTMYLYATLGGRLPGLHVPGVEDKSSVRRSEVGAIDRADELPTRWLGYNTVDLAILSTSNDEFISALLNDTARRTALLEWVRRGGQLVLAVGRNQGLLQNREDLKEFLPVDFTGSVAFDPSEKASVHWPPPGPAAQDDLGDIAKKTPLTVAKIKAKPGRGVSTLASVRAGESGEVPFVVQAPYGLGRVTLLTTDPDQPPFTRWEAKKQGDFWLRLVDEAGPIFAETRPETMIGADNTMTDLAQQLQRSLENFDAVPVIQFGWVALFILIYILIVGPLDYLFLKKVVKRLELTWVTFPLVVIIVSAAAYFTAYALKGNDQRIQKIDLIDFDLNSQTAQGNTWFSIFSPRVQNYTIGVEPASVWGVTKDPISPPVVSWLARANNSRQSLFRRSYEYDTNAGGLTRVPIQVWSVKSFQANWHHRIDPNAPPMTVDLRAAGQDGKELTGSVTSNLPVDLQNVVVFYRGNVYDVGTLSPGANNRRQVTTAKRQFDEWARTNPATTAPQPLPNNPFMRSTPSAPKPESTDGIMRELMFHERFETQRGRTTRNAEFRELDESWRLPAEDPGAVAIVYGVVPQRAGQASDVIPAAGTVTSLWLGVLPGGDANQRNLSGTMRQETHLRFFVPVKRSN